MLAGDAYEFKGVICLIDGVNFLEQLGDTQTVDRQLAHCHLAVINKIDLIDAARLKAVMEAVRRVNPNCEIVSCQNGAIDLSIQDRSSGNPHDRQSLEGTRPTPHEIAELSL